MGYFGKYLPHLARKFLAPSLKCPINLFRTHLSLVYPALLLQYTCPLVLHTSLNCIRLQTDCFLHWRGQCWQRLYAHILSPSLPHQIFRLATPLHRRHNYEQSQQTKPSISLVMQKQTMGVAKKKNTTPHISHTNIRRDAKSNLKRHRCKVDPSKNWH